MQTRVVFNQKGGVGKSTISTNLAAISAKRGLKTLLVDLDAQCNSTHYAGIDITDDTRTVADMFKQTVGWFSKALTAKDFIQPTAFDHLFVMPAAPALADIERELESRYKMFKLRDTLKELETQFDRIYIDTPPNFNFYSKAALIAADSFLIPFDCDDFSAQAIERLLDNVMELKSDHNPDLVCEGIIINQFNAQANLPKQLVASLIEKGLPVLKNHLSASVKVRESHSQRKPLAFFAPSHKLSQQFGLLFDELER
ncbi:ParA family protein [Alteromonas oceanisediminis]|uniref:ParA family protein n=1 Tax=Alteromonas oceanisediminis TaxID=2836180 RepID=UPI001BDA6548|nr:ParA family protein [Alteromonas oceanisediminis]MBT0585930.1 ParA family protein [Alteromonas oceanisediminis]